MNANKLGFVAPLEQARSTEFEIAMSRFDTSRPNREKTEILVLFRRIESAHDQILPRVIRMRNFHPTTPS
jgi:hypothetical protein